MGSGDQGVGHFGGLVPGDLQLGLLAQQFEGAGHALRAFGMKFLRIVEATFISDHVHELVWGRARAASTVNNLWFPVMQAQAYSAARVHAGI